MKPFLAGRKTSDAPQLRPPHTHRPTLTNGKIRALAASPVVDVVKEGDKVVRIVITCTCGEKVEVECLYPGGA